MAKKILVLSEWYAPAWKAGGPIRSLLNLMAIWPFESYVYTGNYDLGEVEPLNVPCDQWIQADSQTHLYYQDLKSIRVPSLLNVIKKDQWDGIYINSLFSFWFSILPLLLLKRMRLLDKVVLAPRGMLHEVALSQKSMKKKVFILLAKSLGLWKGITWHATSEEEVKRIRKIVNDQARIKRVSNVPHINPRVHIPAWSTAQNWLLVARVSPEKGILESIQWLSTHSIAEKVTLHVVGPLENREYHRTCLEWIARHTALKVIFHGALPFEEINSIKEKCHVFYLATKGENFGHAIAEALLSGMPVIISDRTPWNKLRQANVGWDTAWSKSAFHQVFDEWDRLDENGYQKILADIKVYRDHWKANYIDAADWEDLFSF